MGKDLKGKELGKGISQRADGNYMARYVDRYKKRHTFYGRDLKTLRRKLEKARYESEQGMLLSGDNITLSEWFEEFLKLYKEGKVKETTLFRIRQTYSPCRKNVVGMMRLQEIRAIHIQQLINELDEMGFTYGTINLLRSLLNDMFKKAVGNGYMLVNPCEAVVMPRKVTLEARFLTEQESCHFFFTSPKTESSNRCIPLLPETEAILKRVRKKQLRNKMLHALQWKNEPPFDDMVFTTQQGVPIRYGDVNRTIKSVVLKANLQEEELAKFEKREPFVLKPFSPHCFRHTFVTRCKMNGVPYETIQPYVGHSDKETTAYYDHNKKDIDVGALTKVSFLNVV